MRKGVRSTVQRHFPGVWLRYPVIFTLVNTVVNLEEGTGWAGVGYEEAEKSRRGIYICFPFSASFNGRSIKLSFF